MPATPSPPPPPTGAWIEEQFDRSLVDYYCDRLGPSTELAHARVELRKRLHKPHVRQRLEQRHAKLQRELADLTALLLGS